MVVYKLAILAVLCSATLDTVHGDCYECIYNAGTTDTANCLTPNSDDTNIRTGSGCTDDCKTMFTAIGDAISITRSCGAYSCVDADYSSQPGGSITECCVTDLCNQNSESGQTYPTANLNTGNTENPGNDDENNGNNYATHLTTSSMYALLLAAIAVVFMK